MKDISGGVEAVSTLKVNEFRLIFIRYMINTNNALGGVQINDNVENADWIRRQTFTVFHVTDMACAVITLVVCALIVG